MFAISLFTGFGSFNPFSSELNSSKKQRQQLDIPVHDNSERYLLRSHVVHDGGLDEKNTGSE